jgi:hypothetical protein
MPFQKGNQLAKGRRNRHDGTQPKTIWLLQSLAENGVNLQELLAKSLIKASQGDRQALELSHLLAKFLPHVVNAPKADHAQVQIETLVINRLERPAGEGHPPSIETTIEPVNIPSQSEEK